MTTARTHLQRLEAGSIQISREAVAGSERPVLALVSWLPQPGIVAS